MAVRRMFSKEIIDTDTFLALSLSAQCLYFHLGMNADDDGFVGSPKRIMKTLGCSDSDLAGLVDGGYIIPFDSGIIVIKHWRMNNYLRNDRRTETVYKSEKSMLQEGDNGEYLAL